MFQLLHYCQVKTAPSYNDILSAIIVAWGENYGNKKNGGGLGAFQWWQKSN